MKIALQSRSLITSLFVLFAISFSSFLNGACNVAGASNFATIANTSGCVYTQSGTGNDGTLTGGCANNYIIHDYTSGGSSDTTSLNGHTFPVGVTTVNWMSIDTSGGGYNAEDTHVQQVTIVVSGDFSSTTFTPTPTTCAGLMTGMITIDNPPTTATGHYSISPNEGTKSVSSGDVIYSGLDNDTYVITWTDGFCTATSESITVTEGPTVSMGPPVGNNPSSCGGTQGFITIPGLDNNTDYIVTYRDNSVPQTPTTIMSSGSGNVVITGLDAGTYDNFVVDLNGCTDSDNADVILSDPSSPNPGNGIGFNPTTVGGTQGNITIPGLLASTSYTLSYKDDGSTVNVGSITTNGSGNYVITTLNAGTYTDFSFTRDGCTGVEAGPVVLTNPDCTAFNPSAAQNSPSCNNGNNGSILVSNLNSGTGNVTIAWDEVGGPNDNSQTGISSSAFQIPNLPGSPGGNNYNITITDAALCVKVLFNIKVFEAADLSVTITGDLTLCANESTTILTATAGFDSYSWTGSSSTTNVATVSGPGTYTVTVMDGPCSGSTSVAVTQSSAVSVSVNGGQSDLAVSCSGANDAKITVNTSGGNGPYTYSWTGPNNYTSSAVGMISSLAEGTYNLTVTDTEMCTGTMVQIITTPNAMGSSVQVTDAICDGETNGSVNLSVMGGTAPYGFSWSNGSNTEDLTNVGAGMYTVVITDDNGCSISTSATVFDQDPVVGVISPVNPVICLNKEITLTASGGTSYDWGAEGIGPSITVSPTSSTTYNVVVTDAGSEGCTDNASISVTVNTLPPASIAVTETSGNTNNDSEICQGDAVTLNGSGGVSYQWSGGGNNPVVYTPLNMTTYTVTVTDANGCTATSNETIEVNLNPDAKIDEVAATKVIGAPQIFKSGSTGNGSCSIASCSWDFGNNDTATSCNDNVQTTYATGGNYNIGLTVVDNCGCVDTDIQSISIADADDCNIGTFALNGGDPKGCINTDIDLVVNRNSSNGGTCAYKTDKLTVIPPNSHVYNQTDNTIKFSNTGVYTLKYEIEDECQCGPKESTSRTITIEDLPQAEFTVSNIRFCEGTPLVVNLNKTEPTSTVTIEGITSSESEQEFSSFNLNLNEDKMLTIVKVETDLCTNENPSGNTELNIDFIEKFEILMADVSTPCNELDNTFVATIPTAGGNGELTVLKGSEFIESVDQNSGVVTTKALDPAGSYEFILRRGTFCEPDTFPITQVLCNCTFGVGKMGENDILLCEDDVAIADFQLGEEFNEVSDTLLFVLHNKSSGENLGTVYGVSDKPEFSFMPDKGMILGVPYFIAPIAQRGMRSPKLMVPNALSNQVENNIDCISIERGTLVVWYESPTTNVEGPVEVCRNERDVLFEVDNPLDGSDITWTVDGLPDESVKERGNKAFIHFNGSAEMYTVSAVESVLYTIGSVTINCSNTTEFIVSVTDEVAPEQTNIIRWPGDIFVATADNVTYSWGIVASSGGNEIILGEFGKYFFPDVPFELDNILLFVDVKSDDNSSCTTRTYFNSNEPPGFIIPNGQEFAVDLFPNPNSGDFKILLTSNYRELYKVEIFNGVGMKVHSEQINKKLLSSQNYVELHGLSSGVYFARITNQSGSSQITEKIIVH